MQQSLRDFKYIFQYKKLAVASVAERVEKSTHWMENMPMVMHGRLCCILITALKLVCKILWPRSLKFDIKCMISAQHTALWFSSWYFATQSFVRPLCSNLPPPDIFTRAAGKPCNCSSRIKKQLLPTWMWKSFALLLQVKLCSTFGSSRSDVFYQHWCSLKQCLMEFSSW